nr:CBS domain-containing protein [Tissierella sp.]
MYISDIMTKDVISVRETDTVGMCADLLIEHNLSGMPVLDDLGRVVGMVTEGDLIRRASKVKGPAALEVLGGIFYLESPKEFSRQIKKTMGSIASEIMTKDVYTIDSDKEVEEAASILVEKRVKRLPVVNREGSVIGIISRRDILKYLFEKY